MRRLLLTAAAVACALVLSSSQASAQIVSPMLPGTLTTFAGTGVASSVDGSLGTATFNGPRAMVRLNDGSLLITDLSGSVLRKVSPTGLVSTVANTSGGQPLGLAVAPDQQTVYWGSFQGGALKRLDSDGIVTTVANAGAWQPYLIDTAANGDLYVAKVGGTIERYRAAADGIVEPGTPAEVVAGGGSGGDGGPAVDAALSGPRAVAVNADGSFAIAEYGLARIRVVDSAGTISTLAGNGTACGAAGLCGEGGPVGGASQFNQPIGIITDGYGGYFVSDAAMRSVRHIAANGTLTTVAGTGVTCAATDLCGDGGPARLARLRQPAGMLFDKASGVLLIADSEAHRVRQFTPDLPDTGIPGPAGPQGPTGADGPGGPAGANGLDGAPGANGADGRAGNDGANGTDGPDGAPGRPGRDGADGLAGPAGLAGSSRLASPLLVALPDDRFSFHRRATARVRYFVTGPAKVTATLTRKGRRIRTLKRTFKNDARTTLSLGAKLARGSYRLTITARRGKARAVDRANIIIR